MRLGLGLGLAGYSRRNGGFSPSTLFALAESGVWYDPSDLATLFTDPAGTTAVTTPGQTVGLMLDKSKGLVLGAELLGNPSFTSSTNYNLLGGATISGGQLFIDNQTNSRAEGLGNFLLAGKSMVLEVDVASTTGSVAILIADNTGSPVFDAGVYSAPGIFRRIVFGANTNGNFRIIRSTGATVINSISFKELPGNHATQSTLASRPIYGIEPVGGRRNLLERTEEFDNAAWSKQNGTITSTSETAPDGTSTADKFTPAATASSEHRVIISSVIATSGGFTLSLWVKPAGYSKFGFRNSAIGTYATFDLSGAGSVIQVSGLTASIAAAVNGFYRVEIKDTSASIRVDFWPLDNSYTTGSPSIYSYTGDGTSGILLWGAQLELGTSATAYQRVLSQYDVTEAGVASTSYLAFDGVDDGMVTGTITPGVDKAQVFAGVRKLSDAAIGMVVESSLNAAGGNAFQLRAPGSAANTYLFGSAGSASQTSTATGFSAPITNVLAGFGDISGDTSTLRVNGVVSATNTADQGTGNFLAYPLYIGRRGGTTLPFSGRIYSLITRFGANLDAGVITNTETWVAGKTGIVI